MGQCSSCDRCKDDEQKVYLQDELLRFRWQPSFPDPFLDGDGMASNDPFLDWHYDSLQLLGTVCGDPFLDDACSFCAMKDMPMGCMFSHRATLAIEHSQCIKELTKHPLPQFSASWASAPGDGEELADQGRGVPRAPPCRGDVVQCISPSSEPIATPNEVQRGTCASEPIATPKRSFVTGKARPPGKAPPLSKAPPPGKAPPSRKTPGCAPVQQAQPVGERSSPVASAGAYQGEEEVSTVLHPGLPKWQGPRPAAEWKARRLINWQPVRQVRRWQGSVWEQAYKELQADFSAFPDELLNTAFMQNVRDGTAASSSTRQPKQRLAVRRLPQQRALTADLLHAQLLRLGIRRPSQVCMALGTQVTSTRESEDTEATLPEEALELLLALLELAAGKENQLCTTETGQAEKEALVPVEAFLRELLSSAGPLCVLQQRAELALHLSRFPEETAAVSQQLEVGIEAVDTLIRSSTIPKLLQGVLIFGNYVNAHCDALSGALGISLDSLVKFAQTRCNSKSEVQGSKQHNALHILIKHLQQEHPTFLEQLSADLECCREARDLDPKVISQAVEGLANRTRSVQSLVATGDHAAQEDLHTQALLHPKRLQLFLKESKPTLQELQQRTTDFENAVVMLRQWFAEPAGSSFMDMMQSLAELHEALTCCKGRAQSAPISRHSGTQHFPSTAKSK